MLSGYGAWGANSKAGLLFNPVLRGEPDIRAARKTKPIALTPAAHIPTAFSRTAPLRDYLEDVRTLTQQGGEATLRQETSFLTQH
jgi:hypothetical protein